MTGKQHDPNRPNTCTPEAIPIGSTSGDDSEDDTHMSKAEIKAKKKRERQARKQSEKVATKDISSPAKSGPQKKGKA